MAVYPNEFWPAETIIQGLDGTTDLRTGLPYIPKGTGPASQPSYEIQYNRRQARENSILAAWRQGMVVDEGNLVIGIYPIEYTQGGQRKYFAGASGISIPANTAKVVYLDSSSSMQIADDWPADISSYLPLASVSSTTSSLSIDDRRPRAAFHVPSVETGTVRDRRILTTYRASIAGNQANLKIYEFDPREDLTIEEVQIFCSATTATAGVDIRAGGSSILTVPATPVAGAIVKPAIADPSIQAANNLGIHVTTNATGDIGDLMVTLLIKAPLAA